VECAAADALRPAHKSSRSTVGEGAQFVAQRMMLQFLQSFNFDLPYPFPRHMEMEADFF